MALVHKVGWDPRFVERSAWFWPLARAARRLAACGDWPSLAELDALYAELTAGAGVPPLCFRENVRKRDKRAHGRVVLDALYDGRIAVHGEVPTRERDWHDLFNALCFATFPRSKRALHARQFAALERRVGAHARTLPAARTREQDALTLFDEGGVVVAAAPAAAVRLERAGAGVDALAAQLVELERAGAARVVPFGHALFEHLVEGLICPGGGTRVIALDPLPREPDELVQAVDVALAAQLADPARFASPREHLHLRWGRLAAPYVATAAATTT